MVVGEIWRYPVKSMGGERVEEADVGALGIDGDRRWGVRDLTTGRILTGRRAPDLLGATAHHLGDGALEVVLPDGTVVGPAGADATLSAWLDRPVALVPSSDPTGGAFEVPDVDEREWTAHDVAGGAWHDSGRARVSVVSRTTLGDWDGRRFRSNLLVSGSGEDDLIGAEVAVGTAVLAVTKQIRRCVMVGRPQPGVEEDRSLLRTILRERSGTVAVGALVLTSGRIATGDPLLRTG
jgi:uncharacterized protein YcbX